MRGDGPTPASKPFNITRSDPALDHHLPQPPAIEALATGWISKRHQIRRAAAAVLVPA
jgi:hypothetical protein